MLPRDGVIARYILAFCFFLIGSQMTTAWAAAICAILGCVELATALLRYSPLYEIASIYKSKTQPETIPDLIPEKPNQQEN